MEKGTLVEFRLNGHRRLAVADRPEGKKHWIVIDERGQAHTLHPRQITYEVKGERYQPKQIEPFLSEVAHYLDPAGLEIAWELLVEDGDTIDPDALALILFSDQAPSLCYAAYCLLSDDKLYFKQKGDRYEPRSPAQVSELKHQQSMEAQRQQEWQGFLDRAQAVLSGESVDWQSGDRSRLDALERLAVFGEEATHRAPALETLAALERPETPDGAFQLLVDLKLWSPHENLLLRRSQVPTYFAQRILDMAHRRLTNPPPDPDGQRLDLTHLKLYTIDDESTREIDDGLSIEHLGDYHRIWIHIADPTRWLSPGDELDLEARRRGTTLYLPTGMIPMFPSELATGPMSLVQGQVCCALSFGVVLNDGGEIQDYTITPSLVKPTYRLTYDDVDEILELGVAAEDDLRLLAEAAECRRQWRQQQGAISIHMPESSIKVVEDAITISVLDESPSRKMVAEMMILAGAVAGCYGQHHNLPLPFRGQAQPELPPQEELIQLPAGPVRDCAIRRCMPKSEMDISPTRHASLGLDTYTQVTSPIRRYTDLIAHFQIKAHLRSEPLPFLANDLRDLMLSVKETTDESTRIERSTNRYWGLEYLRRNMRQPWHALMLRWLREHESLGLVLLEDLGLELAMRFSRPIELGERLMIQAAYVNPRQDMIQFTEVVEQPSQTPALL
jgi:exoribonuclease-2